MMRVDQYIMKRLSTATVRPLTQIFYGWFVVAGAFVVSLLGFGVAYTFASFLPPLQQTFAATRGDISFIFALSGFLYFCLGVVSGPIADRLGPRRVTVAGMLCIGIGMVAASQAQVLWQVYVTYSLGIGLGAGFSYVPSLAVVQRWFVRQRGFASGMAVAGIGVGTLIMPPLATWLIGTVGWRDTYVLLGVVTLLIGPAAALLLEHSPQRRGLLPDGDASPGMSEVGDDAQSPDSQSQSGPTLAQVLRMRSFWLLYAASLATALGLFTPFAHLSAYASDHGFSAGFGALLIGLIGVGSIGGRFLLGKVADRLGLRISLMEMLLGMMVMFLWWLVATSTWALVIFAVCFGVFYGGFVALLPALTAACFGVRRIASIIGLLFTSVGIGTLLGPGLAGIAYDLSHSYLVPILASAVANLAAVLCIWQLRTPTQRKEIVPARSSL
ncbi:MAG: MFS transporter [Ktedonobacteraceae bacterium]|nr:MFS transporter [Ktedonobacteraceae bacterium]